MDETGLYTAPAKAVGDFTGNKGTVTAITARVATMTTPSAPTGVMDSRAGQLSLCCSRVSGVRVSEVAAGGIGVGIMGR